MLYDFANKSCTNVTLWHKYCMCRSRKPCGFDLLHHCTHLHLRGCPLHLIPEKQASLPFDSTLPAQL